MDDARDSRAFKKMWRAENMKTREVQVNKNDSVETVLTKDEMNQIKQASVSFNEHLEVEDGELHRASHSISNELNKLKAVISPLNLIARRLETGGMTKVEAAQAIRGLSILMSHKCDEALEAL